MNVNNISNTSWTTYLPKIPSYIALTGIGYLTSLEMIDQIATTLFKQHQYNATAKTLRDYKNVCSSIGGIAIGCIPLIIPISIPFVMLAVAGVFLALQFMKNTGQPAVKAPPDCLRNLTEEAKTATRSYGGFKAYYKKLAIFLNREDKNCVILVGPAGTGKTAIVEGLAYKIANGQLPNEPFLKDKTIYSFDLTSMLADTQYQGQLERKMKEVLEFAEQSNNTIIFIDEIHGLKGAGGRENAPADIFHHFKSVLARGKIVVIAATTPREYALYIAPDTAIMRRFECIEVSLPSPTACFAMLQYQKSFNEKRYLKKDQVKMKVMDIALAASIFFKERYPLPNQSESLIDAAKSFIDSVCSKAVRRVKKAQGKQTNSTELPQISIGLREVVDFHASSKKTKNSIQELEEQFINFLSRNPTIFPNLSKRIQQLAEQRLIAFEENNAVGKARVNRVMRIMEMEGIPERIIALTENLVVNGLPMPYFYAEYKFKWAHGVDIIVRVMTTDCDRASKKVSKIALSHGGVIANPETNAANFRVAEINERLLVEGGLIEQEMLPLNLIECSPEKQEVNRTLITALKEFEDVYAVYHNINIDPILLVGGSFRQDI